MSRNGNPGCASKNQGFFNHNIIANCFPGTGLNKMSKELSGWASNGLLIERTRLNCGASSHLVGFLAIVRFSHCKQDKKWKSYLRSCTPRASSIQHCVSLLPLLDLSQ